MTAETKNEAQDAPALNRLPPFLATHFEADYREDVPDDVFDSARAAANRVLQSPEKFPEADFDYLAELVDHLATVS